MSNVRMVGGGNTVDFDPISKYVEDHEFNEVKNRSFSGKLFIYQFNNVRSWSIGARFIPLVDRDKINAWRLANTVITLYPNFDDIPGTFYSVVLVNKSDPLSEMVEGRGWRTEYSGVLNFEETS